MCPYHGLGHSRQEGLAVCNDCGLLALRCTICSNSGDPLMQLESSFLSVCRNRYTLRRRECSATVEVDIELDDVPRNEGGAAKWAGGTSNMLQATRGRHVK